MKRYYGLRNKESGEPLQALTRMVFNNSPEAVGIYYALTEFCATAPWLVESKEAVQAVEEHLIDKFEATYERPYVTEELFARLISEYEIFEVTF